MSNNIKSLYRLPDVPHQDYFVRTMRKVDGYVNKREAFDNDVYFGIEVEIEQVPSLDLVGVKTINDNRYHIWNNVEDGSLRNNGREFVSIPMLGSDAEYCLNLLKTHLEKNPHTMGYEFTSRTSVHVHVNAQDMTPAQVRTFLLAYIVVEPLLYKFCSGRRHKNIFCVPLNQSYSYAQKLQRLFTCGDDEIAGYLHNVRESWRKYLGLNLIPLGDRGTIEFRHMPGTLDLEKLLDWLDIIAQLKYFAVNSEFKVLLDYVMDLNTNSQYMHIVRDIFPQSYHKLLHDKIKLQMEDMVTFIKSCVTSNNSKEVKAFTKEFYKLDASTILSLALLHKDIQPKPAKEELVKRASVVRTDINWENINAEAIQDWLEMNEAIVAVNPEPEFIGDENEEARG